MQSEISEEIPQVFSSVHQRALCFIAEGAGKITRKRFIDSTFDEVLLDDLRVMGLIVMVEDKPLITDAGLEFNLSDSQRSKAIWARTKAMLAEARHIPFVPDTH